MRLMIRKMSWKAIFMTKEANWMTSTRITLRITLRKIFWSFWKRLKDGCIKMELKLPRLHIKGKLMSWKLLESQLIRDSMNTLHIQKPLQISTPLWQIMIITSQDKIQCMLILLLTKENQSWTWFKRTDNSLMV